MPKENAQTGKAEELKKVLQIYQNFIPKKKKKVLPAKLKFARGCACNMHTALVFLNRALALRTRFGVSQYPVQTNITKVQINSKKEKKEAYTGLFKQQKQSNTKPHFL